MKTETKSSNNQESKPGITVVVVTYCRPRFLDSVLVQLNNQTLLPNTIIVVDNDSNRSAQKVVDNSNLQSKNIRISYVPNDVNSLSLGRNLGVSLVETEFTCLLDDDVVIPSSYLENVLRKMRELPDAIGIQGFLNLGDRSKIKNFISFLIGGFYLSDRTCRVRWSISTSYPKFSNSETPLLCEWISGTNQFYRTQVIKKVKWDVNFIKYSDGEDLDHSLRISRSGFGSLYLLPNLAVKHLESPEARLTGYKNILMREAYSYYLLHKLFPKKRAAHIFFVWSKILTILLIILKMIFSNSNSSSIGTLRNYLNALNFVFKNKRDLQKGNLGFVNSKL